MISSLLCETCIIKHRQEDSRDSFNQYDYWLEEDVPCIGLNVVENEKQNVQAINITKDMSLFLKIEINVGDKVIYDNFEYDVILGGLQIVKDIVSGNIEYYVVNLEKRTAHPPEMVEIKRR